MNQRLTFKSKIGFEIMLPVIIILGGLSILYLFKEIWVGLIINLSVTAFILHMIATTYYTINKGTELIIKCGFFVNKRIKIESIKKIVETRNPISSPALSLDRLELFFNKFDSILVSPEDKNGFIEALKLLNDQIEVKLKNSHACQDF